jgi:catechol 2,3-dioxygenase-like lactoylglutathione lyase family enzyme
MALEDADLMAFVPTTDLARARTFYVETLGLRCVEDTPIACVLDAHGTTLRVTAVEQLAPHPFTVLGWWVDDIAEHVAGLMGRGVVFERFDGIDQDPLGIWTTPGGDHVAWFRDLDENLLSLTQRA